MRYGFFKHSEIHRQDKQNQDGPSRYCTFDIGWPPSQTQIKNMIYVTYLLVSMWWEMKCKEVFMEKYLILMKLWAFKDVLNSAHFCCSDHIKRAKWTKNLTLWAPISNFLTLLPSTECNVPLKYFRNELVERPPHKRRVCQMFPQIGKNVHFTPYLLIGELISDADDLPMEMTKLNFARHSSITELCLAKIKHENILGGSLDISSSI